MTQVLLVLLVIPFFDCSNNADIDPAKEPFVGSWITIEAVKDGILQSEWSDLSLVLEQDSSESGFYEMADTPNESIWKSMGNWSMDESPDKFILDDSIEVIYSLKNDTLLLQKSVPDTSYNCDSLCLPIVYGQWLFKFKKE